MSFAMINCTIRFDLHWYTQWHIREVLLGGKETSSHVFLTFKVISIVCCQMRSTVASLADLEIDTKSKEDRKEK